jgi:hypothetical protein
MNRQFKIPNIETFNDSAITTSRKFWQEDSIWEKINEYPRHIRENLLNLKQACHLFFSNKLINSILKEFSFTETFLKKFCYFLTKEENLEESLVKSRWIESKVGFDWLKCKIKKFFSSEITPYFSNFHYFRVLKYQINCGRYRKYGINDIHELAEISLKGIDDKNKYHLNLKGKSGLFRAKQYCKNFYKKHKNAPLISDLGSKLFSTAINLGYWKKFEIYSWGDLLWESLGSKITSFKYVSSRGGLEFAKTKIKQYFDDYGKPPSIKLKGFNSFYGTINGGYWKYYGYSHWNELIKEICDIYPRKQKSWDGPKGLLRAKTIFENYYSQHQCLPTCAKLPAISGYCSKRGWKDVGIDSWNDLLQYVFGKINVVYRKWATQDGLKIVVEKTKELKKELKRKLKLSDFKPIPVAKCFYRKYWSKFGILKLADLEQLALC